jgi:integrase
MGKEHRMTVRKRGQVWHYQFQYQCATICGTLPDANTEAEAKQLESDERTKLRLGIRDEDKPVAIDDDFCTFVNDVYLTYSKENNESYVHDEFRCKVLTDYFAGKRFREIKMLDVVRFIKTRLATKIRRHRQKSEATKLRSPVTVHKEVTLLSSIFNMAVIQKVAVENPCRQVPKNVRKTIRARSKRHCGMTLEKERELFERGLTGRYAHLKPLCMFDRNTGLRFGEITRLQREHFNLAHDSKWVEIDGESHEVPRDCFIVVKSKTGKARVIPMNAEARSVAEYQLNDATVRTFVFPSSKTKGQIKEVKKGLAGACKQAGIAYGLTVQGGITFHTFRHWFSSRLEDLGVSKTVRRDLLGHEPKDMTDDYTHSTIEMRRRAVQLLCQTSGENVLQMVAQSGKSLAGA